MPEDKDLISQQEARDAVEPAHLVPAAQVDQAKIDRIVKRCKGRSAGSCARADGDEETGFGKAETSAKKTRFCGGSVFEVIPDFNNVGVVPAIKEGVEIAARAVSSPR